jgi:hypothetical protein
MQFYLGRRSFINYWNIKIFTAVFQEVEVLFLVPIFKGLYFHKPEATVYGE